MAVSQTSRGRARRSAALEPVQRLWPLGDPLPPSCLGLLSVCHWPGQAEVGPRRRVCATGHHTTVHASVGATEIVGGWVGGRCRARACVHTHLHAPGAVSSPTTSPTLAVTRGFALLPLSPSLPPSPALNLPLHTHTPPSRLAPCRRTLPRWPGAGPCWRPLAARGTTPPRSPPPCSSP